MGDEVSKHHFKEREYILFQQKLDKEMDFVRELFAAKQFDDRTRRLGYELELCLLDRKGNPAPLNQQILDKAKNPLFTYELAKFNLEINGNAFDLEPGVFSSIEQDLDQLYAQVVDASASFDTLTGLFGVLPSLKEQHLDPALYMSEMHRYEVLNERLMAMRDRPIYLDIQGIEQLQIEKNDVMLEAMGTSLQIHVQVPFAEAVDSYHASLWASMAVLAVSANSPLVLGKRCWQESRIAIFKQSVDTRNAQEAHDAIIPRVHFGKGYVNSILDLFEDNSYYSPILPEVVECGVEKLHHFNLHNGTIWRWVRPILGQNASGEYHLRLELRVAPSGPTLVDTIANMVFYVGLTEGLKLTPDDLTRIPFDVLEQDFYQVARNGLNAKVSWCHGEMDTMQNLLLERAIPVACKGLENLGIEGFDKWIEIIQQRVETAATGSNWILQYWQNNPDASALVRNYLDNARKNLPVHLWPKP
jgi:hypothetical protein